MMDLARRLFRLLALVLVEVPAVRLARRLFYLPSAMLRHFRVTYMWLASMLYAGDVRAFLRLLVRTPWLAVRHAWVILRDNP